MVHRATAAVRNLTDEAFGEVIDGPAMESSLVDEMWTLWKQEFVLLGDEDERHRHFVDTCRELSKVGCVRDHDGGLVGFWSARSELRVWRGCRFEQVYVPHYVMRQDVRGRVTPYLEAVRSFMGVAVGRPGTPVYVVAGTFPGSYIAIRSGPTTITTLADDDPWATSLLRDVAATMGGPDWDSEAGLIRGHRIPKDSMRAYHPRGRHAAAFADYVRLNPTWQQGTVLPVLVQVSMDLLAWSREIAGRLAGAAARGPRNVSTT